MEFLGRLLPSLFGDSQASLVNRCATSYNSSFAAYDTRVRDGLQPNLPGANFSFLLYANAFYIVVTASLYTIMKRREKQGLKGFKLKPVIFLYNITCIVLAGYCAVSIILHKMKKPGSFACNVIDTGAEAQHLAFVFWIFYIQKFWEFLDTWFFILRQSFRQVTFLHLFHHTSITLVVGSIIRFDFCGDMFLPIICNSVVHVLMYSHYAVSLLGIQSWWRPYLTSLQLMQFILISTQAISAYNQGPSCGAPDFAKVVMVIYMASMLILFGHFFVMQYVFKRNDASMCGVIKTVVAPQRMTYSGMGTFDKEGKATVHLPPHYDSTRHRRSTMSYQLTAVGGAMPGLHVAQEIQQDECDLSYFCVAGGKPSKRVSWQVTAEYVPPEPPAPKLKKR